MTDEPVAAPDDVPAAVREPLADCSPDELRAVAEYASALAAHRDGASAGGGDGEKSIAGVADDKDDERTEGVIDDESATGREAREQDDPDDRPAEVPSNATVTTKEINDNRYYYWQWREGDTIKSKYKSPVDPDE